METLAPVALDLAAMRDALGGEWLLLLRLHPFVRRPASVTPDVAEILPAETEAAAFELLSRPSFGPLPPYLIALDAYVAGSPACRASTPLSCGPARRPRRRNSPRVPCSTH